MSQMSPVRGLGSSRSICKVRAGRSAPVVAAGLALALLLPACGGNGGGGTPSQPTTPTGPTQSNITVSVTNLSVRNSTRPGFNYDLLFTLTVAESAGLGANFNFIRGEFFTSGGVSLERQEITASQLGRVPPSQSLSAPITLSFNSDPNPGRYVILTFNFTDDRNNNLNVNFRVDFV